MTCIRVTHKDKFRFGLGKRVESIIRCLPQVIWKNNYFNNHAPEFREAELERVFAVCVLRIKYCFIMSRTSMILIILLE